MTAPIAIAAAGGATSSGSPSSAATTVPVSAGTLVVVPIANFGAVGDLFNSPLQDSAGNNYAILQSGSEISQTMAVAYAKVTNPLPIGTTFTATVSDGSTWYSTGAWAAPGYGLPIDPGSNVASGLSPSSTVSITPAQASELIFYAVFANNGGAGFPPAPAGFTSLFEDGGSFLEVAYNLPESTATLSAPITLSGGGATQVMIGFPALPPAPTGFDVIGYVLDEW